MSVVATKFYDSVDDIAPTINLINHSEEECNNKDYAHRAGERGSLHLVSLKCVAYWWSVGGDVHVVVVDDDGLQSTRATVRLPAKDYVSFQVTLGPQHTIVIVGVSLCVEFVLCRIEVSKREGGFSITAPFEPLIYKSHEDTLAVCRGSAIRSMTLLDIPPTTAAGLVNLVATNGFSVFRFELNADGTTHVAQVAEFEGARRATSTSRPSYLLPPKVVVQSVVAAGRLVLLVHPSGAVMVYDAETMTLQFQGAVPVTGLVSCVNAHAQDGTTRVALGCTDGAVFIATIDTSSQQVELLQVVSAPTVGCRLSSMLVDQTDCYVMWSDNELPAIPTTLLTIFEGPCFASSKGCATILGEVRGGGTSLYRWCSAWGASDAFAASHVGSTVVLEGTDDARVGGFILHSSAGVVSVVHDSPLDNEPIRILSQLRLENEYFSHTATRLDLTHGGTRLSGHTAFMAGMELLTQLKDLGLFHMQYLYERTLSSPAQFSMFAEFQDLQANAAHCYPRVIGEEDVTVALDYIAMCELPDMDIDVNSKYTATAVLQVLSCRLMYLQCVYIAWVVSPSVGIPSQSSTVTTRIAAMVEVTVGAILYVETVGSLNAFSVSNFVNRFIQYDQDDVAGLVSLGAELTTSSDVAGLHAGEAWASTLRHRVPVMSHYLFEAAVRANDRSGSATCTILGLVNDVASSLAMMPPSRAAVVIEKLMSPYGARTRYFWPCAMLEEIAMNNSHLFIEAFGATTLYRVLALRRLINPSNHSSCLDGSVVYAHFIPDVDQLLFQIDSLLEQFPEDASLLDMKGFVDLLLVDVQLLMARCAIAVDDVAAAMDLLTTALKATHESKSETVNSYVRDMVEQCLKKGCVGALRTAGSPSPQVESMILAHLLHIATSPASSSTQREIIENGRYMAALTIHEFLTTRSAFGLNARLMYEVASFLREGQGTTVNTPAHCNSLLAKALLSLKSIPKVSHFNMDAEAPPVDHPLLRCNASEELLREDSSGRTIVSRLVNNVPNRAQVGSLSPMGRADIPLLQLRRLQCMCESTLLISGHGVVIEAWGHPGSTLEAAFNAKLIRELLRAQEWDLAAALAAASDQSVSSVLVARASHLASSFDEPEVMAHQWELLMSAVQRSRGCTHQYTMDVVTSAMGTCPAAVPKSVKKALLDIDLSALLRSYLTCGSSGAPSVLAGAEELRTIVVGRTGLPDIVALEGLDLVARYLCATNEQNAFVKYDLPENAFVAYPVLERWAIVAMAAVARCKDAQHQELLSVAQKVKKLVTARNNHH